MQKRINAGILALLCAVMAVIPLTGVKESFSVQNVEKSAVVKSVGLDDTDVSRLSFVQSVIADTSPSHPQAVIEAQGKDFSEAENQAQILADKYLTLSYARHFVFGMPTAEKGVEKALNYLLSSPILQLSSYIYICEGEAWQMLEEISKDDISTDEVLANLNLAGKEEGYYSPVSVLELAKSVSENRPLPVPIIGEKEEGKNTAKKSVPVFKGYAVLQGGKLRGVLGRELSRAYNLLANRVERTVFTGARADMRLTKVHSTQKIAFKSGKTQCVLFQIKVRERFADLKEQNAASEEDVRLCKEEVCEALSAQTAALFKWCKENRLDILQVKREIQIQSFGTLSGTDDEVFTPAYTVSIRQMVDRSYTLNCTATKQ